MSVLLVQPPVRNGLVGLKFFHEPIALECISADLAHDCNQITLLDAGSEPDIEGTIVELYPDFFRLTVFNGITNIIRKTASLFKAHKEHDHTANGGSQP